VIKEVLEIMNAAFIYNIPVIFSLSIEGYIIALTIAFPTFFFLKWLFKKFIKPSNTQKPVTWLTTLLLVPVIYEVIVSVFFIILFHEPNIDFDKSKWTVDRENRFKMAKNIIDSEILIGKDTNQIKQLLGNPYLRNASSKAWNYDMGTGGGGLGFLFHTLYIKFDKNKVASVLHQEVKD
jgi:NADH:ubiquinone oxidoreductase subunit 5 (subunit L)/multisubunit Na+/H+ antiporter MnhA subunit